MSRRRHDDCMRGHRWSTDIFHRGEHRLTEGP
jgi:hypothetical protein